VTRSNYQEYLTESTRWQLLRSVAFRRADYRCERCKRRTGLELHHLHYDSIGHEELEDIEALCTDCHKEEHSCLICGTLMEAWEWRDDPNLCFTCRMDARYQTTVKGIA